MSIEKLLLINFLKPDPQNWLLLIFFYFLSVFIAMIFVMEKMAKRAYIRDLLASLFAFLLVTTMPVDGLFTNAILAHVFSWFLRFLFCVFVFWLDRRGNWHAFQKESRFFPLAYLVPFLIGCFSNFLFAFLSQMNRTSTPIEWGPLGLSVGNVFWVVLCEELFFRGILINFVGRVLLTKEKPLWTVAITATAFALVHLVNLFSGNITGTLVQVAYTWVLGAVLATVRLWTRSVIFPLLGHFLFNLFNQTFFEAIYDGATGLLFYLFSFALSVLLLVYAAILLKKLKVVENRVNHASEHLDI